MRKFIVTAVLAMFGAALLALPASASFDHHFTVLGKVTSSKRVGAHGFAFTDKLLNPLNRHDRVGRDRGVCKEKGHVLRCHALFHLNGEIGGFGDILVRGDLERRDHRVNVVGGTNDFNAVAGKALIHDITPRLDRVHFDLVR